MHRTYFQPKPGRRIPHGRVYKALMYVASMFLLAACSDNAALPVPSVLQPPTSATWLMIPGTYAEYQDNAMTGTFDARTGLITRISVTPAENFRITNLAHDGGIARVYGLSGVTVTTVDPTLHGALLERRSANLIGEAANEYAQSIDPPEPLITAQPVVGEDFMVNSIVNGATPFQTRYATIAVDVTIDGFAHATETVLIERPGSANPTAYVQVFSDGEIAEIWFGPVALDGSVTGSLLRRVGMGRNP